MQSKSNDRNGFVPAKCLVLHLQGDLCLASSASQPPLHHRISGIYEWYIKSDSLRPSVTFYSLGPERLGRTWKDFPYFSVVLASCDEGSYDGTCCFLLWNGFSSGNYATHSRTSAYCTHSDSFSCFWIYPSVALGFWPSPFFLSRSGLLSRSFSLWMPQPTY